MSNPILKQAVVIGAGIGGLAAAKAVARHFEKVIAFDRDALPDEVAPRLGTLQARHSHELLAGGCRALEHLFPGIEIDLVRMRLRRDTRYEVPGFDPLPHRDFGFDQFALSRPALERVCRRRVEQEPNIEFRPRPRVTELIASPDNGAIAGGALRGHARNAGESRGGRRRDGQDPLRGARAPQAVERAARAGACKPGDVNDGAGVSHSSGTTLPQGD
jgi:2-polyprenyl-6-methoxyphenol hydroxylase-like FAD-dependent oxidoreductase